MTDERRPRKRRRGEHRAEEKELEGHAAEESERALGRAVAIGIPAATLLGAVVAGVVASLGSALLVLAAGALVGTIALLWASVRTLSGDAPLAAGFVQQATERADLKALLEDKRRALRALKDLESEHSLGKIDDDDYKTFAAQYREEAKRIFKAIDDAVAPYRDKAEEIAREYLAKRGLAGQGVHDTDGGEQETKEKEDGTTPERDLALGDGRVACRSCDASNEADAAFCKQCGASMRGKAKSEVGDVPA
jgi:hypothetical protein